MDIVTTAINDDVPDSRALINAGRHTRARPEHLRKSLSYTRAIRVARYRNSTAIARKKAPEHLKGASLC